MFNDPKFRSDFETWRAGRPDWQSLIKAVRSDAPDDELLRLAGPAGTTLDELRDFRQIRQRALRDQTSGSKFPVAQKKLAQFDTEVERLRVAAEKASADNHADAMSELQDSLNSRQKFMDQEYIAAELAAKCVEFGKSLGLT